MDKRNIVFLSYVYLFAFFGCVLISYINILSYLPYILMFFLVFAFAFNRDLTFFSNKSMLFLLIYELYMVIICIYNKSEFRGGIFNYIRYILVAVVLYDIISNDLISFLKTANRFSEIFFILNSISVFLFKDGIIYGEYLRYPVYLLGTRNSMGSIIITFIVLKLIYSELEYNKITKRTIIVSIIGVIAPLYLWSATTIVGVSCVLLFGIIKNYKVFDKIINKISMIHIFVIGLVLFYLFNIQQIQQTFAFFIENILHKSITMTARTSIWDKAYFLIQKNKWIGYGAYHKEILDVIYFIPDNTHSMFLEILLTGGIVGLILLTSVFISLSNKCIKMESTKAYKWVKCYMLVTMVMGISEATNYYFGFIIFIVLGAYLLEDKRTTKIKIRF